MESITDILHEQERILKNEISELQAELKKVRVALNAIEGRAQTVSAAPRSGPPTVNDAILEAIKNGRGTPTTILDFIQQELGLETTKNSVSTRLSRMKADGQIDHDSDGEWIIAEQVEASNRHRLFDVSENDNDSDRESLPLSITNP